MISNCTRLSISLRNGHKLRFNYLLSSKFNNFNHSSKRYQSTSSTAAVVAVEAAASPSSSLLGTNTITDTITDQTVSYTASSIATSNFGSIAPTLQYVFYPFIQLYDSILPTLTEHLGSDYACLAAISAVTCLTRCIIWPSQLILTRRGASKNHDKNQAVVDMYEKRKLAKDEYNYQKMTYELHGLNTKKLMADFSTINKTLVPMTLHMSNFGMVRYLTQTNLALLGPAKTLPWVTATASTAAIGTTALAATSDPITPFLVVAFTGLNIYKGVDDISFVVDDMKTNFKAQGHDPEKALPTLKAVGGVLATISYFAMLQFPIALTWIFLSNSVFNFLVLSNLRKIPAIKPYTEPMTEEQKATKLKSLEIMGKLQKEQMDMMKEAQNHRKQMNEIRDLKDRESRSIGGPKNRPTDEMSVDELMAELEDLEKKLKELKKKDNDKKSSSE